ncbi:MAG TPA: hypothetical protein VMR20_06520 [Verrucomicrobiae bacterium]|nr:hypothetical protein [Verrucomicrobiae bacterium]
MAAQPTKFAIKSLFQVQGSKFKVFQAALRARGFHVGEFRHANIELEPTATAIQAAEEIAIALRSVEAVGIRRIEGQRFNKTLVGLGDLAVEFFPAPGAVAADNDINRLGAGV